MHPYVKRASVGALLTVASVAAFSASTTGNVSVTIQAPLEITKISDLSFGTILRPVSGTVCDFSSNCWTEIGIDSVQTASPDVTIVTPGGRAEFVISGEPNANVTVTVGSIDVTGPGGSIHVTGIGGGGEGAGSFDGSGNRPLYVGGVLPVAPTTASGVYSGTFTVDAIYP